MAEDPHEKHVKDIFKWIIQKKMNHMEPTSFCALQNEYNKVNRNVSKNLHLNDYFKKLMKKPELLEFNLNRQIHLVFIMSVPVTSEKFKNLMREAGTFQLDKEHRIAYYKTKKGTFKREGVHPDPVSSSSDSSDSEDKENKELSKKEKSELKLDKDGRNQKLGLKERRLVRKGINQATKQRVSKSDKPSESYKSKTSELLEKENKMEDGSSSFDLKKIKKEMDEHESHSRESSPTPPPKRISFSPDACQGTSSQLGNLQNTPSRAPNTQSRVEGSTPTQEANSHKLIRKRSNSSINSQKTSSPAVDLRRKTSDIKVIPCLMDIDLSKKEPPSSSGFKKRFSPERRINNAFILNNVYNMEFPFDTKTLRESCLSEMHLPERRNNSILVKNLQKCIENGLVIAFDGCLKKGKPSIIPIKLVNFLKPFKSLLLNFGFDEKSAIVKQITQKIEMDVGEMLSIEKANFILIMIYEIATPGI